MPEKIPVRTAFVVIALHRAHPHVRLWQARRNDDYVFQPLAGQIDALRECAAQNGQQSDLFLPLFKRAQQRVFFVLGHPPRLAHQRRAGHVPRLQQRADLLQIRIRRKEYDGVAVVRRPCCASIASATSRRALISRAA